MEKKFYIRQRNIITGPFDRQFLINMINQDKLSLSDAVSTDKIIWQSPQIALNLLVPEKACKVETVAVDKPTRTTIILSEEEVDANGGDFSQTPSWSDTLLNVIASLGNGSGYLHRLNQYNSHAMLSAGVIAIAASLLFVLLGVLLFGSCYNVPKSSLALRCLIVTLLSGAFFWGGNELLQAVVSQAKQSKNSAANFLAAMHAMLNMSIIGTVCNGTFFIFNGNLFAMSPLQICAVLAVALLPVIFFSANTILSLRINFMSNCQMSPGTASLVAVLFFYAATILSVCLLYTVYRFV